MDESKKYIVNKLNSMSPESARAAIANGTITVGPIDSPNYKFAISLIEAKAAALRAEHDARLEARSAKMLRLTKIAIAIAIIAIIIAVRDNIKSIISWLICKL